MSGISSIGSNVARVATARVAEPAAEATSHAAGAGASIASHLHGRPGLVTVMLGGITAALIAVGLVACARSKPASGPTLPPTPGPTPPTGPTLPPTPAGPTAPPDTAAGAEVTIGQLNAKNLFDTVDDPGKQDDVATPAEYQLHLTKLARTIRDTMGAPDAITLEEVENEAVLRDLVAQPELAGLGYVPVLREGRDPRGIDVAVLYRSDRLRADSVATWDPSSPSSGGRPVKTFTRPPLAVTLTPVTGAAQAATGARQLTLVAAHLTSRLQGTDGERRRSQQAAAIAAEVDAATAADPTRLEIVSGDLNMEPGEVPFEELVGPRDAQSGNRFLLPLDTIDAADRYSYGTGSRRAQFDHVLVASGAGAGVLAARIPHVNTGATKAERADPSTPRGASDHDPVVVRLAVG